MTETPETDKVEEEWRESWSRTSGREEMAAVARKMERERDEARRMAEHNRTAFLRLAGGHPESIRFPWESP